MGFDGGKSIVDDYLREVRPLLEQRRTYQRTIYRPGEVCQFDLWEPSVAVPVGQGQNRRACVVVACLGYPRAGAGASRVLEGGAGRENHPNVKAWLAKHARFELHFTPTSSSWLNMVEIFFGRLWKIPRRIALSLTTSPT